MRKQQQRARRSAVFALVAGTVATLTLADGLSVVQPAAAQSETERKKRGQEPQRPPQRSAPNRPPAPSGGFSHKPPPARMQGQPVREKPALQRRAPAPVAKPPAKAWPPSQKPAAKPLPQPPTARPLPRKPAPDRVQERQKKLVAPPPRQKPPAAVQKPASPVARPPAPTARPGGAPGSPATAAPRPPRGPVPPFGAGGPAPKNVGDLRKGRQEKVEDGGRRRLIEEPGSRLIVKENNRAIIRHDESRRFLRRPGARTEKRPDGNVQTSYNRPDGVRVITELDRHGRLLRRYRRYPDGREHNIVDNRRFYRNVAIGVGIGAIGIAALALAPPRITIPMESYIVDYDDASDDDLDEALMAEPLEPLERAYSLDEVRYSQELRARMRRIDLDTITFDSGAWEVTPDQHDKLERIARAILRVLAHNPDAVFLVEGHTDAIGSDDENLSLSDRRVESVAEILSEVFDVPPENLVTQGYGEQHLKIDTQEAEPRNRRVSIVNITHLMAER